VNLEFRMLSNQYEWNWINSLIGVLRTEDTTGIIAIDLDTDLPVGACIMDNWTRTSVQAHFALTKPMAIRHNFLECCFNYIFVERDKTRVYGLVPGNNKKAIKFNPHIGFTLKTSLEDGYDTGIDYLIFEMKRENCRFIEQPAQKKAA
jgi:hypothetical protein